MELSRVVDRRRTTHQIENLEKSPHASVSLHLYSRPIDACVVFDQVNRYCERRQLVYYSAHGLILANPAKAHEPRAIPAARWQLCIQKTS